MNKIIDSQIGLGAVGIACVAVAMVMAWGGGASLVYGKGERSSGQEYVRHSPGTDHLRGDADTAFSGEQPPRDTVSHERMSRANGENARGEGTSWRSVRRRLAYLRWADPPRYRRIRGRMYQRRHESLRRMKREDPDRFNLLMERRRQALKMRLNELKESDPQRYERIVRRIQHMREILRQDGEISPVGSPAIVDEGARPGKEPSPRP